MRSKLKASFGSNNNSLECAGKAKRRRAFSLGRLATFGFKAVSRYDHPNAAAAPGTPGLPPHSKELLPLVGYQFGNSLR
jgi:hypothetical protein